MRQLAENPFHRIYDIDCNYLPGYLYLLKFHVWICGSAEAATAHLHHLKYYTLLFDFGSIMLLLSMRGESQNSNLLWGMFAFNAAYWYNTLNWGQVDSIPAFFVLLCLKFLMEQRAVWGVLAYLMALNVKLQAVVFAPLIIWLLLNALRGKPKREILSLILAAPGFQALLVIPFIVGGSIVPLWRVVIGSVDYFSRVSMNAFNFWYLLLPETVNPVMLSDRELFLFGIDYHRWGLMLLCSIALIYAWFLFGKRMYAALNARQFPVFCLNDYLLAGAVLALLFFYFPTQMHERYSHQAWLLLGLWSFRTRHYVPFFLFSIAYYLNLELVLRSLELPNYDAFYFQPKFIALLYGILMMYLLYVSYRQGRNQESFA